MKLRKSVKKAMAQLHIDKLRRNQLKPINTILDERDTLVIAPTSFGKSLIYLIPALAQKTGITIVIEPLIALMHDQVQKLKKLDISAAYLDSTQTTAERKAVVDDLNSGCIKILYIAPERLESDILSLIEENNQIQIVVVDECHCVTTWGNTFRDAYLSIRKHIDALQSRPVIVALSATAIPEDRPRIMDLLSMCDAKIYEMSLYRSNLCFMKKHISGSTNRWKVLRKTLKKYHQNTTIVFCNTIETAEYVAKYLKNHYPKDVAVYHSKSKKYEQEMLSGKKHIIVATSALSMGVDVPNVDLVIHFNMPLSVADYYQMAGRAGREGQHARSILFYNQADYRRNDELLKNIEDNAVRKHMRKQLETMKEICEDEEHCIVNLLLNALGEPHEKSCRYCTNCQKGR